MDPARGTGAQDRPGLDEQCGGDGTLRLRAHLPEHGRTGPRWLTAARAADDGRVRTRNGESVLARVVRIFEAFTAEDSALTVSEIARRTGLHVATASRLVAELVSYGCLARDSDRRVRIGVRMWELATRASPTLSLRDAAMPFMEGVHDVVGHHVQLGVLDGDEVLFLERLSAPGAVINYTR